MSAIPMNAIDESTPAHSFITDTLLPRDEQYAITRTLAGDVNAFNELVVKYQALLYSVAYRMLHSREAAADAVQDSFIKAFRALPSFKYGSFKSWLMRILVNTCHDVIRINRRYILEEISDEPGEQDDEDRERGARQMLDSGESPQGFVERMELSAQIESGLRALSPEYRLALALRDIHGYSYDEIGEITGVTLGTVKSRISRARLELRDFLLQQPELPPAGLKRKTERTETGTRTPRTHTRMLGVV